MTKVYFPIGLEATIVTITTVTALITVYHEIQLDSVLAYIGICQRYDTD